MLFSQPRISGSPKKDRHEVENLLYHLSTANHQYSTRGAPPSPPTGGLRKAEVIPQRKHLRSHRSCPVFGSQANFWLWQGKVPQEPQLWPPLSWLQPPLCPCFPYGICQGGVNCPWVPGSPVPLHPGIGRCLYVTIGRSRETFMGWSLKDINFLMSKNLKIHKSIGFWFLYGVIHGNDKHRSIFLCKLLSCNWLYYTTCPPCTL